MLAYAALCQAERSGHPAGLKQWRAGIVACSALALAPRTIPENRVVYALATRLD